MFDRRLTSFAGALFVAALFVLAGCASEPEPKPQKDPKETTTKKSVKIQEPSAEELAKSPCANPDWAQLPPGAEDKAPSQNEQPAEGDEPAGENEAAQGKQSQKGELHPNVQPCS